MAPKSNLAAHATTLLQLVLEADEDGLKAGEMPKQRVMKNLFRVVNRINPGGKTFLMGPDAPLYVQSVNDLMKQLYRSTDIEIGSLHVGAIMFRDVFARIYVPIGYGHVELDPLMQCDLSSGQKRWLVSRPKDYAIFCEQFVDLTDFAFGLQDINEDPAIPLEAKNFSNLAHFQLEAAAATVTGRCDLRGAVQCSILATELILKAALLYTGCNEKELKRGFGHDLIKMIDELTRAKFSGELERVLRVVKKFPLFVPNRYSTDQPTRVETGHILMGAQYVASEVMRRLSGRDVRVASNIDTPREYP